MVGSNNLLMAYVHLAHNCVIGNNVILANAVNLAGHVTVEDFASVGGLTPIHQFVRVGRYAFIGGGSRVPKDVTPFVRAAGNPLRVVGLNSVGLMRRGFSQEVRLELKRLYRLFFRSGLNTSQALARIEADLPDTPEIKEFVQFVRSSERGVERGAESVEDED
jgi:UDP-N-acetylglucosamine acyltransferase